MSSILNPRIAGIPPSETLKIQALAKERAARGDTVFGFAAGEPDFETPAHIKEAAAKALAEGATRYSPVAGIAPLLKAISDKFLADNGIKYAPSQIVVSGGAKHSLFNVFMTLCKEGDEVLIPSPFWLSYTEMATIAGAKAVLIRAKEEQGFKVTPEQVQQAITKRSKILVINSPSNPIGIVYTPAEIEALVDVALKNGLYIVSDEIYEKMIYDDVRHVSPASFSKDAWDHTITVNGFSKAYAMTGWRLGYLAGPDTIIKAISSLQSHSTSGPTTFAQHGAVAAITGPQTCVQEMVNAFRERRDYMYQRLTAMKRVTCVRPSGAFYMLPRIAAFGMRSQDFVESLMQNEGVATVPGAPFGTDEHIRLSYACSMKNIEAGMDRMEKFIASRIG